MFSEIDSFLRERGFELHTFLGFGTRAQIPLSPVDTPAIRPKQLAMDGRHLFKNKR